MLGPQAVLLLGRGGEGAVPAFTAAPAGPGTVPGTGVVAVG